MEKLHGGRADGMLPSQFERRELVTGTIHEMEHTDDPSTAMEIAMDHLVEHPNYYDVIEAMESQMDSAPGMIPNIAAAALEEAAVLAREAPVMAQAVRAAAPEIAASARVVVPRAAGWISRAVMWFKQGWRESEVIKKLIASGIPRRAATAIANAAEAFLASELQLAASKTAERMKARRAAAAGSTMRANSSGSYYVWPINHKYEPLTGEGPYGPHDLVSAKTFARISATKGRHGRAVSRGQNPSSKSFHLVRIYAPGTGNRLL